MVGIAENRFSQCLHYQLPSEDAPPRLLDDNDPDLVACLSICSRSLSMAVVGFST